MVLPHFIPEIKIKGHDVIDVNVFHRKLTRFSRKKEVNFSPTILLALTLTSYTVKAQEYNTHPAESINIMIHPVKPPIQLELKIKAFFSLNPSQINKEYQTKKFYFVLKVPPQQFGLLYEDVLPKYL